MSGELRIFNFHANQVRTLTDKSGELWFVAKDVCDVLGLSNPSEALRTLDDDERTQVDPQNFLGSENRSNTPVNLISEAGLYRLVMRSRKQVAKEFQRWLSYEVLPQIRRTGGYVPAGETDEETMARAMLIARRTIEDQRQRISQTESKVSELEPKERFADAVAASDGTRLVGELAKMLRQSGTEIGQNRLFRILRDEGFLGKSGSNTNVPTQRAMELGLFEIKETVIQHADGHTSVSRTPKVTGRGQTYFLNRYTPKKEM